MDIETADSAQKFIEVSTDRMTGIIERMSDQTVSLLCSPPGSGKTSLANALKDFLLTRGTHRNVIYISMKGINHREENVSLHLESPVKNFNNFWTKHTYTDWTECMNGMESMDILLDDADMLNNMEFFWDDMKKLRGSGKNKRILLLSNNEARNMEGALSVGLQKHFGLEDLRLSQNEYVSLLNTFVKIYPGLSELINDTQHIIYSMTGGHAGLICSTFQIINENLSDESFAQMALGWKLLSPLYKEKIRQSRAYAGFQQWSLTVDEKEFLIKILGLLDPESRFTTNPADKKMTNRFIDSGLLVDIDGQLEMIAPMMRWVLWEYVK